ncbi:MAG: outer membrane protein assembly factor BamA [Myxococcaceae bacterium]|nr:outer membrane protein assembly factor BamA [Myxococcaceae bacterium]
MVDVRVEGNRRVEAVAVERALTQKRGDEFDPTKTADDLRALWRLGFFSDIQLLVQRLPQGGLIYVVRVEERPSVREVRLEGNKELGKDEFKEQLEIKPGGILDVEQVRRSAKKIQEKYVDKGFFLAEVDWRTEKVPETNQVDVVFEIREHSKVQVREIQFIGNEHVPSNVLKDAMQTKEASFISFLTGEGTYREELFQRDLTFIQAAYFDRGFINAKVEKPIVTISADKKDIFITMKVEEGEQYRIGKLDFSGDLIKSREELHRLMTSHEGDVFSRTTLIKDLSALTDVYYDAGYAYANINPVTQVHADEKVIDLTFDVQKGRQVTVERIEITGNVKTRDKVIRREMRVYEGELFSGTGLRQSQERINALGFFETVEVTHKPGSTDDQIVVLVNVKEKPTGTFQLGLGFSNVEQWVFTLQVEQNNFLGWGQAVSASAQLSSLRNFVQLSFFDPYFLDSPFIFSTDLYRVQADYLGFVRDSLGGSVNGGYHFAFDPDLQVNLTYTLEQVNVQESNLGISSSALLSNRFRSGVTSSIRPSITWDKRDNRLFPSKGFMLFGSVDYAPSFLGGNFNFARYTAYARYYRPLILGAVFKVNANVGYVQQLDADNPLPISELYFVGGINTVRGYFLRSITPTTRVGSTASPDTGVTEFPIGGDKQLILNVELEFPIFEKVGIRGVVFYDAGNAWGTDERFFEDKQDNLPLGLFHSVGFGFRWFSPIGPLRFEWGIPLNPRKFVPGLSSEGDQPVLFEFTIGNFF